MAERLSVGVNIHGDVASSSDEEGSRSQIGSPIMPVSPPQTNERLAIPIATLNAVAESLYVPVVGIHEYAPNPTDQEDLSSQIELVNSPPTDEREKGLLEEDNSAIFDMAYDCFIVFEHIRKTQDEALTAMSFVMDDLSSGPLTNSSYHTRDFLGLRNSFAFWVDYSGALSLMDSSLDARLRGLTDISSMVVELLDMVVRNLRRRELSIALPYRTVAVCCARMLLILSIHS
jgi:hypothetical protein